LAELASSWVPRHIQLPYSNS